ncbi:MAG: Hsp33 family molecular chaperone HslO [Acidobacteria bacterium]|jgi:molecular chaperone Hsp33|nr:MAG: Hsp33 family molecular chaperone HslO [Acidobacteriota bacterium]
MYKELDVSVKEDLRNYFEDRDYMVISVPKNEPIRVYTLRARQTLETAKRVHKPEGQSLELLSYGLLSSLLLTSLVKHATSQKVLLKVSNKCGTLALEADGMGKCRGFIEGRPSECWDKGTLMVVKELRLGTPYTSIVPVVGRNMKEALSYYFEQSEQTRTYLDMGIKRGKDGTVYGSGYLIQVLSGTSPQAIGAVENNLRRLTPEWVEMRPEELALQILEGMEPRLIGLKEVEYYCPCSEDVARSSLLLLEQEELEELLSEGPAEVVCKFCGRVYRFSKEQLML